MNSLSHISFNAMNLVTDILATVRRAGRSLTWADDTGECSLDALVRHAAALAPAILRDTAEPGGTVALLLPNDRRFDVALLACWLAGRVPVPLNPQMPASTLAALCNRAAAKCIIAVRETKTLAQRVAAGIPGGAILHVIPPLESVALPEDRDIHWPALECEYGKRAAGDTAVILFTSGTEGPNKGVMLTHDNLRRHATAVAAARYYAPGDAVLCTLPKFHCYALLMCTVIPLLTGTSLYIRRRFTPKSILRLTGERRLTHLFIVPSMAPLLTRAARRAKPDFASVKLALSGGGSLMDIDRENFERATGRPLINGYGLTEATSTVVSNRLEDNRRGSAGPPVPGVEVAIWDADGRPVERGEVGEIMVRGPNVMKGYLNDAEATRRAIAPGGWLHTGDWGRLDDDGYLYITGRMKDIIISAGLNIHPREIEDVLRAHPAVAQAAVAGRPDRVRGEAPHAFVVLNNGHGGIEKELLAHCAAHLALAMIPRKIILLDALPVNALGKVQKHLLPE